MNKNKTKQTNKHTNKNRQTSNRKQKSKQTKKDKGGMSLNVVIDDNVMSWYNCRKSVATLVASSLC